MKYLISILFMLFMSTSFAQSQDKLELDDTYEITTSDASVIVGKFLGKKNGKLLFETKSSGVIEIPVENIASFEPLDSRRVKNGKVFYENPNPYSYFAGSSAITLPQGKAFYRNTLLFVNSFQYGITDNISVGGGFEILSLLNGEAPGYFVNAKVGFEVADKLHLGGGITHFNAVNSGFGGLALINLAGTYGSKDHNFTTSISWGIAEGEILDIPFITLAGMTRLSRKLALVSENWIVTADGESVAAISLGIRILSKTTAIDIAAATVGGIVAPNVSLVVMFD